MEDQMKLLLANLDSMYDFKEELYGEYGSDLWNGT